MWRPTHRSATRLSTRPDLGIAGWHPRCPTATSIQGLVQHIHPTMARLPGLASAIWVPTYSVSTPIRRRSAEGSTALRWLMTPTPVTPTPNTPKTRQNTLGRRLAFSYRGLLGASLKTLRHGTAPQITLIT